MSHTRRGTIAVLAGVFVLFAAVVGMSWTLNQSQRNGCERGKLDRAANASGWRTAQTARLASLADQMGVPVEQAWTMLREQPSAGDAPDLVAARKYDRIASGLEERSRIDCAHQFSWPF